MGIKVTAACFTTAARSVELYLEKEIPLTRREVQAAPETRTESASANVGTEIAAKPVYEFFKRGFDIICSVIGLVLASPLFLVFSILIAAEKSGKGVFFSQKRLGKNGKEIKVYKFRSMVNDAENVEKWLDKDQLKQYYSEYKVENDPRVTKVGRFLRRTGLDELPQLVNILKGDLSLVGPRPIQESEIALYGEYKDLLLSVKPGLTGYWQAYCSNDTTYTNKKRQHMELFYAKHCNMGWDIKICFATVGAIIKKAKRG